MTDWTADDIEAVIPHALRDGDMPAVVDLLRLLAVKDPRRAEEMLETLQLGIDISRRQQAIDTLDERQRQ